MKFQVFWGIDFGIDFWNRFWSKIGSKMIPKIDAKIDTPKNLKFHEHQTKNVTKFQHFQKL
jgi:predicted RNA methylase